MAFRSTKKNSSAQFPNSVNLINGLDGQNANILDAIDNVVIKFSEILFKESFEKKEMYIIIWFEESRRWASALTLRPYGKNEEVMMGPSPAANNTKNHHCFWKLRAHNIVFVDINWPSMIFDRGLDEQHSLLFLQALEDLWQGFGLTSYDFRPSCHALLSQTQLLSNFANEKSGDL
ncbi:hypothetical protein ACTXT7_008141 [Hymenolepis weldensis]